ncbi:hypothetical protein [Rhodocytophaga rosea]
MGTSEASFYNWKKKFGSLDVSELRRPEFRQTDAAGCREDPMLTQRR